MQYGRLHLAWGAAHTMPPTVGNGLTWPSPTYVLDGALGAYFEAKDTCLLESYTNTVAVGREAAADNSVGLPLT